MGRKRRAASRPLRKAVRKDGHPAVPNMNNLAFQAAASAAKMQLTTRFLVFPSDEDLKRPSAAPILRLITQVLQDVPSWHCKSWRKMLVGSFPELDSSNSSLSQIIAKLVLRCHYLRATAKPYALHDFVEFCAGQGNLTMACLMQMMHGLRRF